MAFSFKLRRQLTNSSIKSIPRDSIEYYTIIEVQEKLLKIVEDEKDIFDETDVKKIVQSMSYLRKYCQRQDGKADKTVEMVKEALIWRKEHQIPKLTEANIPREFIETGFIYISGADIEGNPLLCIRGKYCHFTPSTKEGCERILSYFLFKALEQGMANGKGWTILVDLTGLSMAQYDVPEVLWVLKVIVNYMPSGLKNMIGVNIPWFAKPLVKVVMSFIPSDWKKIIQFVSSKELYKFIPKESVPKYIENPREKFHITAPPECKPMSEIDVEALALEDKEEFIKFFQKVLELN
ncbi:motile sperm domain-containing protein 2-like isoform X1 [Dinothrombium tinctorium]|uniref:Motile sperm domain-containing protein 2-like isoform X1 n=1 Tax=Dinothrombium tinctorium TaxID=1965070 RepID=A0A3S3SAJ0_9ACAR|nr:motile sperm domain-containing protein 2-like isoform X1 [Dinothrombium tinctorium]RWS12767.1 motile sperm domain-containing protein 2-like isoform X1 [Dinothrombium tinctorium]